MMQGTMSLKFIDAKQAKDIYTLLMMGAVTPETCRVTLQ
jgi:hypothetical protein